MVLMALQQTDKMVRLEHKQAKALLQQLAQMEPMELLPQALQASQ
jgi:hypothetical protein